MTLRQPSRDRQPPELDGPRNLQTRAPQSSQQTGELVQKPGCSGLLEDEHRGATGRNARGTYRPLSTICRTLDRARKATSKAAARNSEQGMNSCPSYLHRHEVRVVFFSVPSAWLHRL